VARRCCSLKPGFPTVTRSDFDLAAMLLQYLRKWDRGQAQYKFNVIGKGDSQGELESNLHIVLSREERQTLLWVWSQFERSRLINTAHDDGWATMAERAKTASDTELERLIASPETSSVPEIQTDPLLGIPNRGEYDRNLPVLAAEASRDCPLSLIVVDIDHFKRFNDSYGHQLGDAVLKDTAVAVSRSVAMKGTAFRYGGEELVVLLPNHCIAEAASVAERIRTAIEGIVISDIDHGVTASLGVSTLPEVATNPEELFQGADHAMYRSKQDGRNKVTCARAGEVRLLARSKRTTGKPSVRLQLRQGTRSLYVLDIENTSVAEVRINQIALEQDGISLMAPVRPEENVLWIVPPGMTQKIEWTPDPNPAASLTRLYSNEGLQFSANVEFVVALVYDGSESTHRQKLAVKVFVPSCEIRQLVG
jgi:diguanylate cyclase (GGDEF)-like protein